MRNPARGRRFTTRLALGVAVLVSQMAAPAAAQVLYGSITGNVRDSSGGALAGVTVIATHQATNLTRETVTNQEGVYSLLNLPQGSYRVRITLQGFKEFVTDNLPVTVNQSTRLDASLDVGNLAETVTVTAETALLQTESGSLSSELKSTEITNLPLANYRNFQRLYDLLPGATPTNLQNAVIDSPARALTTNVNGTARNNNNVRQDGTANIFVWLPHHAAYIAPAETIDTVNVSTNAFDAEQGMAGGAAVTVITKSGTNEFRGSAFEMHDNNKLRSNNFFAPADFEQPEGSRNIFGGTIGGPAKRDQVFFFGSYEGTIERVARILNASVPTEALRRGDFSATGTTIYNPFTGTPDGSGRQPFPGNQIPAEFISPAARAVLANIPLPNRPGLTENFFNSDKQRLDRHQFDAKVNWNRTATHQIWAKYGHMDALVHCEQVFGSEGGGPGLCDTGYGDGDTVVKLATVGHTWTFGPNMVIDGTFGMNDMNQEVTSEDMGRNFGLDVLRLPGTNGPDPRTSGSPAFFAGFSNFGNAEGWIPIYRDDRSYTFNTNVSWLKGGHDVRAGVDVIRHELNHWQPELDNPRGRFFFGGGATALRGGAASNIYNQFAGFLLGLPTEVSKSVQFEEMTAREWQYAFYIRDRWNATTNLTLSYGARFERYPLMRRANRGIEALDWAALNGGQGMFVMLGGLGNNPDDLDYEVKYPWIAPRLGAAYRLGEDSVLRAGYGLSVDPIPFARPLRGFFPLTIAQAFVSATPFTPVGTLDAGIPALAAPDVSSGRTPLPATAAMRSPGPEGEIHRGYIHSWNFTFEHRFPGDLAVATSYVGTATRDALLDWDVNAAGPGQGQAGRPLSRFGRTATTTAWGIGEVPGCERCGHADYHGLQIAANRPFSDGLLIKGAYTLSRAKNSFSGGPFGGADDVGWAGMAWNHESVLDLNYGLAGYDRTHVFSLGFVAELPFKSDSRTMNAIIGGWQVNGILQGASGTPFTVFAPGDSLNAPGNQQVADQVAEPNRTGGVEINQPIYDISAWRPVTEVRFGNETRNSVRGPGFTNIDLSVFRNFDLGTERRIEARFEVFNLFNSPRWNNPANNSGNLVGHPRFMQVTSSNQAFDRQIRLGLRYSF